MLADLDLKKNLFSGIGKTLYYSQPFLKDKDCTSSTFLKEISYKVNLNDLYKVVGTCYVNAQMKYCPILVQITHTLIKREYRCEYLLQVWTKEGSKIYERRLQNPVKTWAVSNSMFVFKPQVGDDDFDSFHLVNLENGNSTLLIKDCVNDPLSTYIAYLNNTLYIANKSTIFLLDVTSDLAFGESKRMDLTGDNLKVRRIIPGLTIHGLLNHNVQRSKWYKTNQVIVVMETEDNQLDFSSIEKKGLGTDQFQFTLKQQRELVQRDIKIDPIQKFQFIIDSQNSFYGISLRKSGLVDIYWNMTLIDSPANDYVRDIAVSFNEIFLLMQDGGDVKGIPLKGSSISIEQSQLQFDEFEFPIVFYQVIKNHIHLFNSFTLIRTTLYVVHGPFISLYNIQESQWIKHAKFAEGEILKLAEKMSMGHDKKGKLKNEIAVVLTNGSIYNDLQGYLFADEKRKRAEEAVTKSISIIQTIQTVETNRRNFKVQGQIFRIIMDTQKNEWLYMMTKEKIPVPGQEPDDFVRLYALYFNELFEVTEGLEEPLDIFTNITHVFSPNEEPYIVLQKLSQVSLYHLSIGKPPVNEEEEHTPLASLLKDQVILQCLMHEKIKNIAGDFHSAMTLNINDHIFLVDNFNFYLYSFNSRDTKYFKDQNCVGLYVVDKKFCYTLSHTSGDKSSGLRLYDINNILSKDTDVSYLLSNVQVGYSALIDWNSDYSRFSMLKSLDCLMIIPALHRNTIAFIGMGRRDSYLATKVIKDKFIALDKTNFIFCWSIVTGKLLSVNKLPTRQDYKKFQIFRSPLEDPHDTTYQREWCSKILIVANEKEKEFDENSFYKNEGVYASANNQVSFAQGSLKEFREFRLIEIISEVEVKEHLVFIHPFYMKDQQRLFFDSKNQYMLEKLGHPRVFLYEKEENKMRRTFKWKCLRRFNKFPEDLENDSGFLRSMSPSFQSFIDINRATNQFVIRDCFSLKEMVIISKDLMDLDEEKPTEIMNRFKWIDDQTIRIINSEGIEKILAIRGEFLDEVEYNVIPLFDNHEMKNPLRHYFSNRESLSVSQVKDRLMKKYQAYKSAYYLEHKREPFSLYQELFTVDYQVENGRGLYMADMSFTFLHWKIMEQLEKKKLQLELIDNKQIELLFYNILPGGNTVLHKLAHNGNIIKKLFQIAHPNDENIKEIAIHVPFIQNLEHLSPMHIAESYQDIRVMDTMLTYLCGYGIDHHSRAIIQLIPLIIEKQLPSMLDYLDSRMVQTKKLEKITKGCLKHDHLGISESKIWFSYEQDFEQKLTEQKNKGDGLIIERPIRVQFVDLPLVYHYDDPFCDEFFQQLANTDQYDIFSKKSIQKLIEFNYPLVKTWTIKRLFIPFVMFQITLYVYLNFIFDHDNVISDTLDFPMQILLGLFSGYFLQNEIFQMRNDGLAYLSSIWNYIDIITPSIIFTVICTKAFHIPMEEELERMLQAIGVFFMWFKFLYFFRIFKSFGYLTRLIIIVINDMKTFLFVMFFTIVAFSDSLLTLSNGNPEKERFVTSYGDSIIYTYRIILGDFNVEEFNGCGKPVVYALFILCTLFNTIVMLNLLIAIISETFSHVKENASNASFQEMASMISENSYLIPPKLKQEYAEKNRYLMIVTDLESEMDNDQDEVVQSIENLRKTMQSKVGSLQKDMKKIKKALDKQETWQETQDFRTQQIYNIVEKLQNQRHDDTIYQSQIEPDNVRSSMLSVAMTGSRMSQKLRSSMKNTLAAKMQQKGRFTMFNQKSGNSSDNEHTK